MVTESQAPFLEELDKPHLPQHGAAHEAVSVRQRFEQTGVQDEEG